MLSDQGSEKPAKGAAFQVFEKLDPLARVAEQDAQYGPPFLRFDLEALEALTEWRTGFEAELRTWELHPALALALALAFHLANGHHGPVGFTATLRALHWSVYLQTQHGAAMGAPARARRTRLCASWSG